MICVAPAVPPVSVHQCPSVPHASAHQCHIKCHIITSMPISAHQCHISVPI
ncbi:unnamed protein product [Staurois parvus]|nr:unnamed protein product [Staurois parvus]